jgi:ATP-binding cassette subfamily B protein
MQKNTAKQTLKLLWTEAWRYPFMVTGALFAVPITVLLNNILPPLIAANILDKLSSGDFVKGDLLASFGPQIGLYVVINFVGILGWRLVDYAVWPLEARVIRNLAERVHRHLLQQSADFHANNFTGSLVSQTNKLISAYIRVADTTAYGTLPLLWGIIFTSIILFQRAPWFVVSFNIIIIIFVATAVRITRNTRRASADHAEKESHQTGALADSVTNVLAVKSFSAGNYEHKRFANYTKRTQKSHYMLMRYTLIQLTSFALFTRTLQILALVFAAISIVYFGINVATVFLILSYTTTIADQLFNFTNNALKNYNRSIGDAKLMTDILALTPSIQDPEKPEKVFAGTGHVKMNNITFKHDGSSKPLFKNFTLTMKPGEKIGLVGHSGSGKTTLSRLLLRFSDVNGGSITIKDQDIRNITQDDLHSKISYVPQEPLLFHRSLKENIAYGKPDASKQEIEAVAKMAHAHDFIKDLPEGYDTLVGERGVKLSGGQRQRIAIARAMLKNAPILVLDEATSALDSESEGLIQDALWKLMEGKTAIVIAHRLSTIQKMDRIIVLDNGKIIEEGSHRELIHKNGKYAELWNRQSGGFMEE